MPFLPASANEMRALGWDAPDFVYVSGDAYIDHSSFGAAIITRVLEAEGFRVAVLAQPRTDTDADFRSFGRPRLGFLVSAGNLDSMVAHYTVAKRRRSYDYYSPGGKTGLRPDRACIVYSNCIRRAFPDVPIILGGLEASLRRFAHYDYWDDRLRASVLIDSGADLLSYGMGENILRRIAHLLDRGIPVKKLRDIRGTVWVGKRGDRVHFPVAGASDFDTLRTDKRAVAKAFLLQYQNTDHQNADAVIEYYGDRMLVQNPPMPPLEQKELDAVYALPYERAWHPMYAKDGGVPALAEVKFSVTHNRGCFGGCSFCSIAYHQGRQVRARSIESVVEEVRALSALPDFKGYIHDVGGPTANFRRPSCAYQQTHGVCKTRHCLAPSPCKNLIADHSEYLRLLRAVEAVPGVKKVFIRSGLRFDYMLCDQSESGKAFFKKLVRDHVSGQLRVAPEHCSDAVLACMGKPPVRVFERFRAQYYALCEAAGLKQYLVPYLMSSHPGSTLADAVSLAQHIKKWGCDPEQVQDFYPTPGTASAVMFYTGIDPFTGKEVFVPKSREEKQLQRALLQPHNPKNQPLVRKALHLCGREDLIGHGKDCLVPPAREQHAAPQSAERQGKKPRGAQKNNRKQHGAAANAPLRQNGQKKSRSRQKGGRK